MKPRLVLALAVALFALTAQGHEFKMDALINAFVRIDGNEAHVVVRAPLFLLGSARFPVKNIEIDVASATAALDRSAGAIAQSIVLYENGRAVVPTSAHARLSLPSDRSFETYEGATAHVAQPPAADTQIYIDQGYVDAHLVYPIAAPESVFSVRTMAARELGDYVKLAVRYMPARGDERALLISSRSGMVDLNPTWWGAAAGFVGLGIAHILTGIDHLLFLLCLLIPLRSWRPMVAIMTPFTIAHSFTLIGAAFGLAPSGSWFPPFVESAIAASIVYMALENIMGADLRRRLVITGLFGLVHGFGFSYGLQESLQFAGTHLLVSLFAFNVGIELGQLLALTVMVPLLVAVRRYVLRGRVGMIILSALAAQVGWNWMLERGEVLWNTPWPRLTLAGAATTAFWIAGILLAAGMITLAMRKLRLADAPVQVAAAPR